MMQQTLHQMCSNTMIHQLNALLITSVIASVSLKKYIVITNQQPSYVASILKEPSVATAH